MNKPPGFCILVAEDDAITRMYLTHTLRSVGYAVIDAIDGVEAFHIALQQSAKYIPLLISDFNMPRMGGAELVCSLKQFRPEMKVIILTGSHSGELPPVLVTQADCILRKPIQAKTLLPEVKSLLSL